MLPLALPLHQSVLFILRLSLVNLAEWHVVLLRGLELNLTETVPTLIFNLLLIEMVPKVLGNRSMRAPATHSEQWAGFGQVYLPGQWVSATQKFNVRQKKSSKLPNAPKIAVIGIAPQTRHILPS